MLRRKRAMTPEAASTKKVTGHDNERIFAELINGDVIPGRGKADVVDKQDNRYSVKGAKWWQIFMYVRNRFVTNTEFLEIGNVAGLITKCLDAFPETRDEYITDKITAKRALQSAMRELKDELCQSGIFARFLSKGIFDGDKVDYLTVLENSLSSKDIPKELKYFHVFSASDVVSVLSTEIEVANSKTIKKGDTDALKVIFLYESQNTGELEIRVDTSHYRKARWRLNSEKILPILRTFLDERAIEEKQISVYGSAVHELLD